MTGARARWCARRGPRGHRRLRRLPAPAPLLRAHRAREEGGPPRRHLLGPAGAGLRRSGRAPAAGRAGAGRARRQPDRARVHRRRLGRLPRRRAARRRLREHRHLAQRGRRADPARRLHPGRRALRAPRQQADARTRSRAAAATSPPRSPPCPASASSSRWARSATTPTWRTSPRRTACARGPRPAFGHGSEARLGPGLPILLGSYHPSRQNTNTGKLTPPMMRSVFMRAREPDRSGACSADELRRRSRRLEGADPRIPGARALVHGPRRPRAAAERDDHPQVLDQRVPALGERRRA